MAAVVATATVLLEPLGALRRGIKTAGREGGRLQLGIMVTLGLGILYLSSSKHRFKLMGPYYETLCLFFFFYATFSSPGFHKCYVNLCNSCPFNRLGRRKTKTERGKHLGFV